MIVTASNFYHDEVVKNFPKELGNPYRLMFNWIQIEIQELNALKASIDSLKTIEKKIRDLKEEAADYKTELNDVTQGRTTIKSIWKAIIRQTPTQEELIRRIELTEKDIEDWHNVLEYLQQYIPQVIFPKFKRERGALYFKFLINFAEIQAQSSEKNIEIWTRVLENCTK